MRSGGELPRDAAAAICDTAGMENGEGIREEEGWVPLPLPNDKRSALSEKRAGLWGLVLESRAIPFRVEPMEGGWALLVAAGSVETAVEEIRLFEEENRDWPPAAPAGRELAQNTLGTLSVIFLVATFHNVTRLETPLVPTGPAGWELVGSADAAKILSGEWWRLVTALTLHADSLHLFSNLAIGGFFVLLLCREIGSGLAWSLLLASGILGNLINSWVQGPDHRSIGASTLIFGALGILAAINSVRYRRNRRRRWTLPAAAAVALLADLGTEGKNTDLGAHLFGFVVGILLGAVAERLLERYGRPGPRTGALLSIFSGLVVVAAWWWGLTARG